jgi:hypothetical protein
VVPRQKQQPPPLSRDTFFYNCGGTVVPTIRRNAVNRFIFAIATLALFGASSAEAQCYSSGCNIGQCGWQSSGCEWNSSYCGASCGPVWYYRDSCPPPRPCKIGRWVPNEDGSRTWVEEQSTQSSQTVLDEVESLQRQIDQLEDRVRRLEGPSGTTN